MDVTQIRVFFCALPFLLLLSILDLLPFGKVLSISLFPFIFAL